MSIRDSVRELVKLFYNAPAKTFYINSKDGDTLCIPDQVFVSLGMTTSQKTMENVRTLISFDPSYDAEVVEIISKKVNNVYINMVNSHEPTQYLSDTNGKIVLGREEAIKEKARLEELVSMDRSLDIITQYGPKLSNLSNHIEKIDQVLGWDTHSIQVLDDGDYSTYHKYVNYKNESGLEYRIGILVNETNRKGLERESKP